MFYYDFFIFLYLHYALDRDLASVQKRHANSQNFTKHALRSKDKRYIFISSYIEIFNFERTRKAIITSLIFIFTLCYWVNVSFWLEIWTFVFIRPCHLIHIFIISPWLILKYTYLQKNQWFFISNRDFYLYSL